MSCRIANPWSRDSYHTTVAFLSSHVVHSISHMNLLQISQFVVNNWNLKTIVATSNHIIYSIQCTLCFSLSCTGEENGNPLQCSCLENPRDRGAWWAAVSGVAQSRTRLKRLSSSSNSIQCTGDRNQDHPQEKELQKAKWLSEEALQIALK